jgi:hypothetical protein
MPEDRQQRTQMTLPPLAWAGLIGAGLMLVLLVIGITMLVVILKDSRDHIRAQDAKTAVLLQKVRAAEPTASQVSPLIGEARPVVRRLSKAIGPLAERGRVLAAAVDRLPAVARAVQAIAAVAVPVLGEVGRSRLARTLDSTNELLAQVRAANLVPVSAHAARETPQLIRRLVRLQLTTLRTQKLSLETQLTTLDILRQSLAHIASIDRKTGGTVPPQGAPVPSTP